MEKLRQFRLLLWKNWLLQLRQPVVTLFEVLLPTLFACLLIGFRSLVDYKYISTSTTFSPFTIDAFPHNLTISRMNNPGLPWELAYCPNISVTEDIVDQAAANVVGSVKLVRGRYCVLCL